MGRFKTGVLSFTVPRTNSVKSSGALGSDKGLLHALALFRRSEQDMRRKHRVIQKGAMDKFVKKDPDEEGKGKNPESQEETGAVKEGRLHQTLASAQLQILTPWGLISREDNRTRPAGCGETLNSTAQRHRTNFIPGKCLG